MKGIILIASLLALFTGTAFGQFAHTQGATTTTLSGSKGTTYDIVLPGAPTVRDVVCVGLIFYNDSSTAPSSITVKDGTPNTYSLTPNSPSHNQFGTSYSWLYLYYWVATGTTNKTITVSWTNSMYAEGWADEFSVTGGNGTFDKDVAGTVQTSSGTLANSPSINPTKSASLLYSVGVDPNNALVAPTAGSSALAPWIGTTGGPETNNIGGNTEYYLSATGSTALNYTTGGSNETYLAAVMSFYIAPPPPAWSKWNGVAVGGSTGNISQMNGATIGITVGNYGAWNGLVSPSTVRWTEKQQTPDFCSACTSKATTITSTSSGDALVIQSTNTSGSADYISTGTIPTGCGGTWVVPTGCQGVDGSTGAISCAYNLSVSGSCTSVTTTFSSSANYQWVITEIARSSGTATYDTSGTSVNSATNTPLVEALVLSGSDDAVITQVIGGSGTFSAIGSPYTGFFNYTHAFWGWAYGLNLSSTGSATWTDSISEKTVTGAIALK